MANWGEIKCPRCAELEDKLAKAVLALQLIYEFTNTHDQRAVAIEIPLHVLADMVNSGVMLWH